MNAARNPRARPAQKAPAQRPSAAKASAQKPKARKAARSQPTAQKPSAKKAAHKASTKKPKAKALSTKKRRQAALKGDATAVLERLARAIPDPHVELTFQSPWQLLIAVILSAQSTDRTVNRVTPELFERWPTPAALAAAPIPEVEALVKSTGFFRNKTKSIRGASSMLVERFGGAVPRTMDEILEVPGVARKTANVVLGTAYGVAAGIVTDTHAMRVAQRLELTREQAPERIEADLCRQFPESTWTRMSHRLVLHGRYVCTARAPVCPECPLNEVCPSRLAPPNGAWEARADAEAADMLFRGADFARPLARAE